MNKQHLTDWEYDQLKKQQRKAEKDKRKNRKNRRDVWSNVND